VRYDHDLIAAVAEVNSVHQARNGRRAPLPTPIEMERTFNRMKAPWGWARLAARLQSNLLLSLRREPNLRPLVGR
jgi:hypothetical protein